MGCVIGGVRVGSAAELARLVGCDRDTAWGWLAGRRFPSGRTALRLARALGVTADAVLLECEAARARYQQRRAAERARLDAEGA